MIITATRTKVARCIPVVMLMFCVLIGALASSSSVALAAPRKLGVDKWVYATGGAVYSSPTVVGNVVYIGSADGNVYALDTGTGVPVWTFQTGNAIIATPAVAGGVVYIGSSSTLYALNATTGTELWEYGVAGIVSSPDSGQGRGLFWHI